MNAFAQPEVSCGEARTLDAELFSRRDTLEHAECVPRFRSGEEFAFAPQFFLASVSRRRWIPRIVVVREGERVLGFFYAMERKVANIRSGVLFVDGTIVSPLFSDKADRVDVLRTAVHVLFSRLGFSALRMLIAPQDQDLETALQAVASLGVGVSCGNTITNHSRLPLASDYEDFLARLGEKTRRNFRRYRRRFEAAGGRYIEQLTFDEFTGAASALANKSRILVQTETVQRALRMLAVVPRPLMAGLRGPKGQWVAILGGWTGTQSAVFFSQLNADCDHPGDSLSVVLRGYVIESLIAQSIRQILFWRGSSSPLSRACSHIPALVISLDAPSYRWKCNRYAAKRLRPWFPTLQLSLD